MSQDEHMTQVEYIDVNMHGEEAGVTETGGPAERTRMISVRTWSRFTRRRTLKS